MDLSEQYLVSCNGEGWGCDGGFWAHDYHEWKTVSGERDAGAVLESDFPYKASDVNCNPPHDKTYQLTAWEYVCGNDTCTPSDAEIKQAIYEHGPVTAAVCVNTAFKNYSSGVFTGPSCSSLNHGVILVGWDDSDKCWIMRNSWGRTWGESGYMRIGYGVGGIGSQATYVSLGDAPDPDPDGQCITADNQSHIAQGRAEYCGFFDLEACAVGSGDNLGWISQQSTSTKETSPGYWEQVDSCPQ